jgi:hypothetical protein
MDFLFTIGGYLFKHFCDVIFDGLLSVVCPWLKSWGLSNRKQLVELKLSSPHMPMAISALARKVFLRG